MNRQIYEKIVRSYGEKYNFDYEDFMISEDESNFDSESELKHRLLKGVKSGSLPGMVGDDEEEEITEQMCRGYSPFYGCKLQTHNIDGIPFDD